MPLKLLRFMNRREPTAGNNGSIGALDRRIGNGVVGQGVFLTGTTDIIPVETADILADAFEQVTVSTTAKTLGTPRQTHQYATVACENVAVRYRLDGQAPTATVGTLLNANDTLLLGNAANVDNAQFISATGGSSTLSVTYGNRAVA